MAFCYKIEINQQEIIANGWNKPFEFEGKKYQADFNTFALYNFLEFVSNWANKEGTKAYKNENGYIWINYDFVRVNNPLCNFSSNAYIKKHLFILKHFDLIATEKDKFGNVYFKLGKNFGDDEEKLLKDLPQTPPQTQKKVEGGQNIEKQSKAILEPKETQKMAQTIQTPKKPYIQEQKDEYSQARLITKNLFEWRGDEVVGFTQDDFSEWLEYLRGIGFKINEISAKRHFEELLRLGENAKKAMDNAILKGLKYPTLPFENGSGSFKGNSSEAKQEKSRYYGADEENEITRAGVSLRYNPKILKSGIGNNDYDKEFWDIIKAKDSKEYAVRSPYSDFSIDREAREYINEAQKQRFEFLQRREKAISQARLAQATAENNSVWDKLL